MKISSQPAIDCPEMTERNQAEHKQFLSTLTPIAHSRLENDPIIVPSSHLQPVTIFILNIYHQSSLENQARSIHQYIQWKHLLPTKQVQKQPPYIIIEQRILVSTILFIAHRECICLLSNEGSNNDDGVIPPIIYTNKSATEI